MGPIAFYSSISTTQMVETEDSHSCTSLQLPGIKKWRSYGSPPRGPVPSVWSKKISLRDVNWLDYVLNEGVKSAVDSS